MRKKILFLITKSNFGGAQRYVYELATSLPKEVFDVTVAFGGTGKKGALAGTLNELLREAGIRTIVLTHFARDIHVVDEFRAFFELLSLLKKERPDVLHLNSSKAGGLGSLAGRIAGVRRIVFTAHGWPHQEARPLFEKCLIYLFSWFSVILSHLTIVVSKQDAQTAPSFFKKNCVRLIQNGISDFPLLPQNEARQKIIAAVGSTIPTDALWIGTISELTKNKGLDIALHAIAKIRDTRFIIIGSGEERGRLELLADNLKIHDRVFFAGFIPNARALLRAFDIYSLTSRKEGLPYALLEAGMASLPSVVTNVGGIPDIVENGLTGLIAIKNTSTEIVHLIEALSHDATKRASFGQNAKRRVTTLFGLPRMIDETIAVY